MTRDQMQQFARFGAEARLQAISEERDAILRAFPSLGRFSTQSNASMDGAVPPVRKRRRMSAAERKAVGRRMRAYWAKRRAEKAAGPKKATAKPKRKGGMSTEARQRQGERMKAYWAAKRAHKETNAGTAAAEAADTGAASSASRKASRKAAREGGRKAGQRQGNR